MHIAISARTDFHTAILEVITYWISSETSSLTYFVISLHADN